MVETVAALEEGGELACTRTSADTTDVPGEPDANYYEMFACAAQPTFVLQTSQLPEMSALRGRH